MYQSKGFIELLVIVIVLAVVAVGGTAYYVFGSSSEVQDVTTTSRKITNLESTQEPGNLSVPQPSALPESTPGTLKTYQNPQAGYSFSYPASWTFKDKSEGCGPVFFYPETTKVWVTVCGPYTNPTDTPDYLAGASVGSNLSSLVSKQNVTISSHVAVQQEIKLSAEQDSIEVYAADVKNSSKVKGTLAIYLYVQDMTKFTSAKSAFDQILNTFKFTN